MNARSLIAFAVASIAVVGCQQADPLIGTWTSQTTMQGASATMEQTFKADKTFTQEMKVDGGATGSLTIKANGTWAYEEGKKLKLNATSVDFETSNEQIKSLMSGMKEQMLTQFNQQPASELTWSGNDQFSTTVNGNSATFARKK